MANLLLFDNNASSLLASGITTAATDITVTATEGALFPAPAAGQAFPVTVEDVNGNIEIMLCTARVGDTLTVQRGYENTAAYAFASGARVEQRPTAGTMGVMLQKTGGDTLSGTTTNAGIIDQGTTGSIKGGEFAGGYVRGAPGLVAGQLAIAADGSTQTLGGSQILTAANLTANLPSGVGVMVSGMVCLWSGASNAIPAGYVLCDGTNGTPDLRDKFVLGGGGALPTAGGSSNTVTGSTNPLPNLTIAATALTIAQLPAHTHRFFTSGYTYSSNGQPPVLGVGSSGAYATNFPAGGSGPGSSQQILENTGTGATHTHALGGTLAHTHTYSLPPYQALFYIMKT